MWINQRHVNVLTAIAVSALSACTRDASFGATMPALDIPACAQIYTADDDDRNAVTLAMASLSEAARAHNKKVQWNANLYVLNQSCGWRDKGALYKSVADQLSPHNFQLLHIDRADTKEHALLWGHTMIWQRGKDLIAINHRMIGSPARAYVILLTSKKS
jgi:hypothetical protein